MTDQQPPRPDDGQNQASAREFGLQRIYLKDASLETPNSPGIFTQAWRPEVSINLNSEAKPFAEGLYEVVLTITVTAKLDDKTGYLVEVQQAGLFGVKGFAAQEMGPMLGSFCPNILFPFAREAISDLVVKAGFPQMLLAPVNFDALYAKHVQDHEKKAAASTH